MPAIVPERRRDRERRRRDVRDDGRHLRRTTLPPRGSTTLTLAGAVAMATTSETGCQGATFTVPVIVGIASTP